MCAVRLRCIVVASFSIWRPKLQNSADFDGTFRKKVRPFLFPFTIDKCNLIYSEFVKVFFVRIYRVFYGSEGQTQSLFFLVCNLRPYFEKVKFDVRRSLEPFKDLGGRFDPSLTALTKRSHRSPTVYVFLAF